MSHGFECCRCATLLSIPSISDEDFSKEDTSPLKQLAPMLQVPEGSDLKEAAAWNAAVQGVLSVMHNDNIPEPMLIAASIGK